LEITDWLRGLSLERYAETFRDNAIDVAVLPELSEADLEKLGVLLGHRKIMLRAIAALRGGAAENIAEPVPASAPIPGEAERRSKFLRCRLLRELWVLAEVACTSCGGANHLRAKFCKKWVSDSRNRKWHQSPKNSALSMPILPSTLPKRFSLQRSLSSCMEERSG
jgi:hypothetical protein